MKNYFFSSFLLLFFLPGVCFGATYYVRNDGSAGIDSTTDCTSGGNAANEAEANGKTYSSGDLICLCSEGGTLSKINLTGNQSNITINGDCDGDGIKAYICEETAAEQIYIGGDSNITFDSISMCVDWSGSFGAGIHMSGATTDNVTIQNCNITGQVDEDTHGIFIASSANAITVDINNNIISQTNDGIAMLTAGQIGVINNNMLTNFTVGAIADTECIKIGGGDHSGLVIADNDCSVFGQDGIDLYNSQGVLVEDNEVHDAAAGSTGNGIKLGGGSSANNTASGNRVYNLTAGSQNRAILCNPGDGLVVESNVVYNTAVGIWCYGGTKKVHNNTVYNVSDDAFKATASTVMSLHNNIFSGADDDILIDGVDTIVTGGYNILINDSVPHIVAGSYTNTDGADQGNTDPLFLNPINGDFRLRANSPAIRAGTGTKFNGTVADIGAPQTGEYIPNEKHPDERMYNPGYPLGFPQNEVTLPGTINFSTTGSTIDCDITVTGSPGIIWNIDGTLYNVADPGLIDFGSSGTRNHTLYVSANWVDVTGFNAHGVAGFTMNLSELSDLSMQGKIDLHGTSTSGNLGSLPVGLTGDILLFDTLVDDYIATSWPYPTGDAKVLNFANLSLSTKAVDDILCHNAARSNTNCFLNLIGNHTPSGTGLACKTTLTNRFRLWVVIVTP